jgi:hypothetical protein
MQLDVRPYGGNAIEATKFLIREPKVGEGFA